MIKFRKEALIFSVLFLIIALVGSVSFVSAEATYSCTGTSSRCGNINIETQCNSQNGCRWDEPTIGFDECISSICEDKINEDDCENSGCKWKTSWGGSECEGYVSSILR
ncbi:hypothetical protein GF378_00065 [Candidatus Pacearchaeota archaeon]|nr:hypothetical protein [Candidatus Pacearchaeota archaeon]